MHVVHVNMQQQVLIDSMYHFKQAELHRVLCLAVRCNMCRQAALFLYEIAAS
jgi:hypothetical protein